MRSDKEFLEEYKSVLKRHGKADWTRKREPHVPFVDMCLMFLHDYLRGGPADAVPLLMTGYPSLLEGIAEPGFERVLKTVRHLCYGFGSRQVWLQAMREYREADQRYRCFEIQQTASGVSYTPGKHTPPGLTGFIRKQLGLTPPHKDNTLDMAVPGDASYLRGRQEKTDYRIYSLPENMPAPARHRPDGREVNPPLEISMQELMVAAQDVDKRESAVDWPAGMRPLSLAERLDKLKPDAAGGHSFYQDGVFTIEGATHVIGMLSSGKSTFLLALLFALAKREAGQGPKTRAAVIVRSTLEGLTLAARLKRHGITATALSSVRNRERHMADIFSRHARAGSVRPFMADQVADVTDGFSMACALDGMRDDTTYEEFDVGRCHRLLQRKTVRKKEPDDDGDDGHGFADVDERDFKKVSCTLWPVCPVHQQQRDAVDAQVLIMTPSVLVHTKLDIWVADKKITIPELLQHAFDIVLVDECDTVQRTLDNEFAVKTQIMGGGAKKSYVTEMIQRCAESMGEKNSGQIGKSLNRQWFSNLLTFTNTIVGMYSILLNETHVLSEYYRGRSFTAGTILYQLCDNATGIDFRRPDGEKTYEDLMRLCGALRTFTRDVRDDDETGEDYAGNGYHLDKFREASESLHEFVGEIRDSTDDYREHVEILEAWLDQGRFEPFHAPSDDDERNRAGKRKTAVALLFGVLTDIALNRYNWLLRMQPAVAEDFDAADLFIFKSSADLSSNYRTLLPANPTGTAFGFSYDIPDENSRRGKGGALSIMTHVGVGRRLLTGLHEFLSDEGVAGPHVLMLSGTSWAGGEPPAGQPVMGDTDRASPTYDVQVPVRGMFLQPKYEIAAIEKSVFSLVHIPDKGTGKQLAVSGQSVAKRRDNLRDIATRLVAHNGSKTGPRNLLETHFTELRNQLHDAYADRLLQDRRRALLVTNSYRDAVIVSRAVAEACGEGFGADKWNVVCLKRDRDTEERGDILYSEDRNLKFLAYSMIEDFGDEEENTILVSPIQNISRGHNILNRHKKGAISLIYFLHRFYPPPEDTSSMIAGINRFAQHTYEHGYPGPDGDDTFLQRSRAHRREANRVYRECLGEFQYGYKSMNHKTRARFAWEMISNIWQTIGRGIRGGVPVYVGFIDNAFAPESFPRFLEPENDTMDRPETSILVECINQVDYALEQSGGRELADALYKPFYDALKDTLHLHYDKKP